MNKGRSYCSLQRENTDINRAVRPGPANFSSTIRWLTLLSGFPLPFSKIRSFSSDHYELNIVISINQSVNQSKSLKALLSKAQQSRTIWIFGSANVFRSQAFAGGRSAAGHIASVTATTVHWCQCTCTGVYCELVVHSVPFPGSVQDVTSYTTAETRKPCYRREKRAMPL